MLTKVKRIKRKKYGSGKEVTTGGVDSIFGKKLLKIEVKEKIMQIKEWFMMKIGMLLFLLNLMIVGF